MEHQRQAVDQPRSPFVEQTEVLTAVHVNLGFVPLLHLAVDLKTVLDTWEHAAMEGLLSKVKELGMAIVVLVTRGTF